MLPDALRREAVRISRCELDTAGLCLAFDELLRNYVPFGAAAWATHDPATGLTTSCTLSGVPPDPSRESMIFASEFDPDEPATYLELIATRQQVAVLSEVTGGDLARAARWREVFSHFGVTDELRAVMWWADQPWGTISLYRMGTTFTADEADAVAEFAPLVGDAVRLGLLRVAASRPTGVQDPPGILTVSVDGDVRPLTTPAETWLAHGGEDLVTSARVVAAALRRRSDWDGASSRVVGDDGRVLTLHASHVVDGDVAVIVEATRPAQLGAMLVDAYGLTPRQRDVLGQLLLGRSLTQVAVALEISEHTANDHRKAIYERTGVSSRSELAALLQNESYDPLVRAGAQPGPYGGFLPAN